MKKTIILNQDSLLKIKESMVGTNNVSHALVCVNEARPEVDEFELGQESDNPPMGANYAHAEETIKEGYYSGANLKNIDLSEVGRVDYEFYFDEEDYNQWLEDNELIDSNESRVKYYTEEYLYDVDYYDSETYHHMASDQILCYDDIKELFGEDMAKTILNNCMTDGKGSFETEELYYNSGYDVNNPQELNDIAMKILRHGEYYKDCRGFILTNGVVVYTESEHNEVQRIPGIDSKFQFIELGNIRVLPNSIDIGAEPTWEQEKVLRQVITYYDGEEFYLDIFSNGGEIGAQYPSADYQYIMGEINRFYSEGIRPQGGYAYESEKKEGKTIKENSNFEVNSSDIDLSSFKKKSDLAPIWQDEYTLDSRVRLRLLDIADDFWEFVNLTWVKPNGIILTGSICNFNWSQFSDIDLHLIVDFDEIDEKTEFVQDYLDAKKNEWNNEHNELRLMGFPVELYVQNVGEMPESGGIYDLEDNSWLKRPNSSDIKSIGLDKFSIKDKAAEIMTIIDDMYDTLNDTTDSHEIEQIGDDAHYLWKKVKNMRKKSLEKNGESGAGNIVYKILRRMKYLDKLWKLSTITYDRTNSIQEGKLPLITESQESKSISAAKKLAMQRLGYNEQEADEFVRVKLRNDMPALRTPEGGKFILGVTRMFCDRELTDAETIGNLNKTIKLVASDAHINEYDRNLNGMSAQDLIFRFEGARGEMLDADKQELASMVFEANNDYEIVRIDSFEQSSQYGEYVSWCVTHDESMFNSYTNGGINQFYFCLKHGFENVESIETEGCPLDEYGLSMIAVSVDGDGGLNTCTCRWNHEFGGSDGIMDTKHISTIIGRNFYDVFKPNNKWKDIVNSAMEKLANIRIPNLVFDYASNFVDGFAIIRLRDRWNFLKTDGTLLSDKWFEHVKQFENGFAEVEYSHKVNFINKEGVILSDQWFDGTKNFADGFGGILLKRKWNFINAKGELLWNKPVEQWFDTITIFVNGFASVKLSNKWNTINTKGQLLWNKPIEQWFDRFGNFRNGFAKVKLNNKLNAINTKGQLLWNKPVEQWFDEFPGFDKSGLSYVKLNDKWNIINTEGQLVWNKPIEQWFDGVWPCRDEIAKVKLNGNLYILDKNGNLTLSESKKNNSLPQLDESVKKYLTLLKEETVADGSSEGNPYKKRWKAERDALKNFIANYGKLMQSKEDDKGGKLYKVFFDKTMSDLIGYNYCICVQWDEQQLKPKSTVYIRALDKFTPFIRRNLQFDTRGMDNMRGTADDLGNTTYPQQY